MLLLIICLFSHYDLLSCVNYEKVPEKFDEFMLMKQHHQNFLQIKDFIKEAQHKFYEGNDEQEATRDDETTMDHSITNWWWDNTSLIDQLGLNTPESFLLPLIRSRPSFPISITPYTTEFNNHHLKWDEIFPDQNIYTRSSESKLHIGSKVSSPLKNPSLPQLPSKNPQIPKDEKPFSSFQPPKLHKFSKPLHPITTSTSPSTSLRDHSGQGFGPSITLITPNEEYKKIWLREITTYTPVERWFQTLATQTGMTPSFNYTTKGAPQPGRTPTKVSKIQALVSTKQLKNNSKDQPPRFLRQSLPLSDTLTEVDDYGYSTASTTTAKTAQFFIEDVGGILHFRIATKNEEKTKMINVIPATVPNDGKMKMTPTTTRDVQYRERDPTPSSRKSRQFHSIARKRKHHYHSHKRQKARQRIQRHRYRHHEYSNEDIIYQRQQQKFEYPMLRRIKDTTEDRKRFSIITPKPSSRGIRKEPRSSENKKLRQPTHPLNAMSQFFSENDETEDEELIKLIERKHDSRHENTNKVYFYHQVRESLKQVESKKKAKRLKLKAELLRKIVEGSSYSDEEASLTRNLIQALQYGNKTFEHEVARNRRDTIKRIIR